MGTYSNAFFLSIFFFILDHLIDGSLFLELEIPSMESDLGIVEEKQRIALYQILSGLRIRWLGSSTSLEMGTSRKMEVGNGAMRTDEPSQL
jgi:hypothetical protein